MEQPSAKRSKFVTFNIPPEDEDLLDWYFKNEAEGTNMSALLRATLRKGIIKDGPPQWFLDWMKDNNGVQPSISDKKVDFEGLWPDE